MSTSDANQAALSVVRREEEDRAREASDDAQRHNDEAQLPGNNDAADRAEEHQANADNLAAAGYGDGYEEAN